MRFRKAGRINSRGLATISTERPKYPPAIPEYRASRHNRFPDRIPAVRQHRFEALPRRERTSRTGTPRARRKAPQRSSGLPLCARSSTWGKYGTRAHSEDKPPPTPPGTRAGVGGRAGGRGRRSPGRTPRGSSRHSDSRARRTCGARRRGSRAPARRSRRRTPPSGR